MENIAMPRDVDEPLPFLMFEIDEVIVMVVCLMVGIVTRELTYAIVLSFVVVKMFSRWKAGKLPGVLAHMMFWFGILSLNNSFKVSDGKEFVE